MDNSTIQHITDFHSSLSKSMQTLFTEGRPRSQFEKVSWTVQCYEQIRDAELITGFYDISQELNHLDNQCVNQKFLVKRIQDKLTSKKAADRVGKTL